MRPSQHSISRHTPKSVNAQSIRKVSRSTKESHYVRFLSTLLPGGGPSTAVAVFFTIGLTPVLRALFLVAGGALAAAVLPPFLIIVVPVEVLEVLLVLLTDRISVGPLLTPRLGLDTTGLLVGFGACGLLALRPNVLAFDRVDLVLPMTTLTAFRVAASAADLAGAINFGGIIGFSGETGREIFVFCEGSRIVCIGGWGRVRELDDFGESIVEGFGAWRDVCPAVTFVRFLGFGSKWVESEAFSLPEFSISSLYAGILELRPLKYEWPANLFLLSPFRRVELVSFAHWVSAETVSFSEEGGLAITEASRSADTAFCCCFLVSRYFVNNSPMFALRSEVGMRLIRSSIRVRRLLACNAYCARSLRARSVT